MWWKFDTHELHIWGFGNTIRALFNRSDKLSSLRSRMAVTAVVDVCARMRLLVRTWHCPIGRQRDLIIGQLDNRARVVSCCS